jgi:metal-dependent hydrolase (beta-lactamase superfamily II)
MFGSIVGCFKNNSSINSNNEYNESKKSEEEMLHEIKKIEKKLEIDKVLINSGEYEYDFDKDCKYLYDQKIITEKQLKYMSKVVIKDKFFIK